MLTLIFNPIKYASFSRFMPMRGGVTIAFSVALVVELVDTRDLKSLGVRAVPVQVRPGAPSTMIENEIIWRVGRVAMQRIANPWTSVRLRDAPPYPGKKTLSKRLFYISTFSIPTID